MSIVRGTGIVSSLTLLSRIFGFIRDLLVARLFGASMMADAFFVAFRIPNLLRSFVAEGALTSAFVPVFTTELAKGKENAKRAIHSVSGFLLITTGILSILGIIFSPEIVRLFAPGFGVGTERSVLCIRLTQIMFPYIIFVSFVAMLNGALNTVKIFGAAGWAQVVMNLVLILGALIAGWMDARAAVFALSISVIVGGFAQVIVQIPAMRRSGFSIMPSLRIYTPVTRELFILMFPAVLGATVYQISIFLNTLLASLLDPGSVSWLFYADRLAQLPIGVFSIALASVILPALSSAAAMRDEKTFNETLIQSLRYTSFFIIPLAAYLYYFAEPIITLLFERGAFTHDSSIKTANALKAFSIGLWSMSAHSMISRAFIAKKDTKTPTMVGFVTLFVGLFVSLALMGPPSSNAEGVFGEAILKLQTFIRSFVHGASLGHTGLALSSSVASLFAFCTLCLLFRRRSAILWGPFITATLRSSCASGVMLASFSLMPWNELGDVLSILLGMLLSLLVYCTSLKILKSREFEETFALIFRFIIKGR